MTLWAKKVKDGRPNRERMSRSVRMRMRVRREARAKRRLAQTARGIRRWRRCFGGEGEEQRYGDVDGGAAEEQRAMAGQARHGEAGCELEGSGDTE